MPSTPAMMTGMMLFMTRSGFNTPMDEMPTPDLAVPYAAPRSAHESRGPGRSRAGENCSRPTGWVRLARGAGRRRDALAKMSAAAAPMKPKKGAEGGQSGSSGILEEGRWVCAYGRVHERGGRPQRARA